MESNVEGVPFGGEAMADLSDVNCFLFCVIED